MWVEAHKYLKKAEKEFLDQFLHVKNIPGINFSNFFYKSRICFTEKLQMQEFLCISSLFSPRIPLVQDVVEYHPGLSFLKSAPEFHSRYRTYHFSVIFTHNQPHQRGGSFWCENYRIKLTYFQHIFFRKQCHQN